MIVFVVVRDDIVDDLSHQQWISLMDYMDLQYLAFGRRPYGRWAGLADELSRSCCWAFEPWPHRRDELLEKLTQVAQRWNVTVTWSEDRTGPTSMTLPAGEEEVAEPSDPWEKIKAVCQGCGRRPDELTCYTIPAAEEGITAAEYVFEEEGTYNEENGHFLCDACYITAGQPSSPTGWTCP